MSPLVYRERQLASANGESGLLPISPTTLRRWVIAGKFPKPYKLGERVTVWDAVEVDAHLQAMKIEQGVQNA